MATEIKTAGGGGVEIPSVVGWKVRDTGASYTTTFGISCAFYVYNGQVKPCPEHMGIAKGYMNGRYVYQLVPPHNYAILRVRGSANPRGGMTPEEYLEQGAMEFLEIHADAKAAELFIESAKNGVIRDIFEDMCHRVPGRFCYHPPGAEDWPVIQRRFYGVSDFLRTIREMGYEYFSPSWFWGGEIKAGWITPTRQGNFIGSARIKAPCWVGEEKEKAERTDFFEIRGNEGNPHRVAFMGKVEVLKSGRAVLVYSYDPVEFMITHPEHDTVHGKMQGLVQFTHLRTRWE